MDFWTRAGFLATAAALMFVAIKLNKATKKGAKTTSIVVAFIAGLAGLATIVGDWMTSADWLGQFAAAGLIVCAATDDGIIASNIGSAIRTPAPRSSLRRLMIGSAGFMCWVLSASGREGFRRCPR